MDEVIACTRGEDVIARAAVEEVVTATRENGVIFTLADAGIASISLASTATNIQTDSRHTLLGNSQFTRTDGSTGTVYEIDFHRNEVETEYTGNRADAAELTNIPQTRGYGLMTDLATAAANDFDVADALTDALAGPGLATPDLETLVAVNDNARFDRYRTA